MRMLSSLKGMRMPDLAELRNRLWKGAGIVRDEAGLAELAGWLEEWSPDDLLAMSFRDLRAQDVEAAFMLLVAGSIVRSALLRKESRGGHIRSDYHHEDARWERAVVMIDKDNRKGYVAYEQIEAKGNAAGIFY